ncbi:MAG: hypothetical protein DWH78_02930 [Planctomycetota bacterium]|jgi:hypothetical protein|nr:MAG: hypothetical protein DWH78_02930 [Planctomycetota bacterium]
MILWRQFKEVERDFRNLAGLMPSFPAMGVSGETFFPAQSAPQNKSFRFAQLPMSCDSHGMAV